MTSKMIFIKHILLSILVYNLIVLEYKQDRLMELKYFQEYLYRVPKTKEEKNFHLWLGPRSHRKR
jgi:hypothetical protein